MRPLLPLLVALSLLAPFALAAEGRGTPPTVAQAERERGDDEDDDDRRPGRGERGERPAAVGAFELSAASQSVAGDFVDFAYNDTGVTDFRVGGRHLFDLHVAGESDDDARGVTARGAELRLETSRFNLRVHDNPAAVAKLQTDGVATLLFPPGATLEELDGERVKFTVGNLTGTLRGDGVRVAGPSVIVDDELVLLVHQPRGGFDTYRDDIGEAVSKRHVGAEASINRNDDGSVDEDVVSYGNVTMRTIKAERGNLTVLIDGQGFDGRVVVLNVDGRIVGASKAEDLLVHFDNASIQRADGVADVLDPDDDGLSAEYYVVFDPATNDFQLLVSIPHYSVRTLSVMTFIQVPPPSVVVGILAGLLVLAASGVVLFRRP